MGRWDPLRARLILTSRRLRQEYAEKLRQESRREIASIP
jgi:hypothetical protein